MPRRIESIHAEHEYGTTTPVVPRIDSPPRMPSRGFQVRRASSSPSVDRHLDDDVAGAAVPAATAATCSGMNCRGIGLIAGSPTASGSPGLVTVPTPGPARNTTPVPGSPCAHPPRPARRG